MNSDTVYFRFSDGDKPFVIALSDPQKIAHARRVVSGDEELKVHVMGTIIESRVGYNPAWGYHLNPDTIDFFELATEVCDASTGFVEKNLGQLGGATLPGHHWCPWSSRLIDEYIPPALALEKLREELILEGSYVLVGKGGGFTQVFTYFVIEPSAETSVIHSANGAVKAAPLLLRNRPKEFDRLMDFALQIDFFNIAVDPPLSDMPRQISISHPAHGIHTVVWATDADPPVPDGLVRLDEEIRNFLTQEFREEFGG